MAIQATQHLAQLNIGRLRYEIGDPRMAEFVDNLARVNAIADRAEGFVWRLQDASGNATAYRPYGGDPRMAINMSVWEDVAALERYVWQTVHKRIYGRRHEWFEKLDGSYFVMWWVPAGHIPTVEEAVMSRWNPFWRTITVLVRLDIAACIVLAAALWLWLTWD
jgi:Domain of unknown function (DUF3291)